ncbi:MAG TPA: pilus assembly protein TadG-related protein [Candidatus Binatia bacterium]|jgi:Flp pilus assembly protein TadG
MQKPFLYRYAESQGGQVIVLAALLLIPVVGIIGVAIDAGFLFQLKRNMQTAADSAAVAGALETRKGSNITAITTAAEDDAALNGFTKGVDNVNVTVNSPPASGQYSASDDYIEVIVNQRKSTFFIRVLSLISSDDFSTATVAARAVAGPKPLPECIWALNPLAVTGLTVAGTASINAAECGVYVRSSSSTAMILNGGACVHVKEIDIVGNYTGGCATPTPRTNAPAKSDPLRSLPAPTPSLPCILPLPTQRNFNPGTYCTIAVSGNEAWTFNPGTYYIVGGFTIGGNATVTGNGVTFYIAAGGSVSFAGTGAVRLSAPTSGTYKGVLLFQGRTNPIPAAMSGGSNKIFNGTIYVPGAVLSFSGGSCSESRTVLIADIITISGSTCFAQPTNAPSGPGNVVLAE